MHGKFFFIFTYLLPHFTMNVVRNLPIRTALGNLLTDACESIATSIIVAHRLYNVYQLLKLKHSAVIVRFNQSPFYVSNPYSFTWRHCQKVVFFKNPLFFIVIYLSKLYNKREFGLIGQFFLRLPLINFTGRLKKANDVN